MPKVLAMQSMELDDEAILDMPCPIPIAAKDRPRFPYGLRISLTQDELNKLELEAADCFVGGMVHLHAMARITSVSEDQMEDGKKCRVELQIEALCIESEDRENEEEDAAEDRPKGRRALYGT